MSAPSRDNKRHTWTEYQTWSDDQRWEIIGGTAYMMSPAPTWRHQGIIGELLRQMQPFFHGKKCQIGLSPLDVRLSEEDVVQPDLLVICDPNQIKRTHVEGAPTLVIEILSPSSASRDRLLKLNLYARAGVKEYWIVTPYPSLVEVFVLEGGRYVVHHVFGNEDTLTSPTFLELKISLAEVFNFPLEPGEEPPIVAEPPAPQYRAAQS